jgi:hypothetical protein
VPADDLVGLGSSSPQLDAGLLRIPCSAALCTALSKKAVEVSLVAHLAKAAGLLMVR